MDFNLKEHTILLTVGGSRAYGIHTDESDVDVKGVAIPPQEYFLGFLKKFEQADGSSQIESFYDDLNSEEKTAADNAGLEGSVYDIRKFVSLAADCNPNILNILFCREQEVKVLSKFGKVLRENRELFLSAKAKHTFTGYAHSQLKRIKGHRQWLLNPSTHEPSREEFNLPEFTLIPADQLKAAQATVKKQVDRWEIDWGTMLDSEKIYVMEQVTMFLGEISSSLGMGIGDAKWLAAARMVGLNDNMILHMQREREYEAARRYWKQYNRWKKERNPARAELEAKYGFDAKHAAHLVRLLRMGREVLETGEVHVWRGPGGPNDAEELLSIRNGAWSYEQLVEWAEREDRELSAMYKAKEYSIPHSSNRNALDKLTAQLVLSFHNLH